MPCTLGMITAIVRVAAVTRDDVVAVGLRKHQRDLPRLTPER